MTEELPPLWSAVLELQQLTDASTITARSHAADEAFATVLDEIKPDGGYPAIEAIRQRFFNLTANRAKKFRARSAVESEVVYHERLHRSSGDAQTVALYRQLVAVTLDTVSVNNATALVAILGEGLAYEEFATRVSKPVGTVKAIVSRTRRRLRECEELQPVLDALRAA
jgi:hypothetical protein